MYYRPIEIQTFLNVIKDNQGFAVVAILSIVGILWFNYSQYFRLRKWISLSKQVMSSIYLVIVILNIFYILMSTQSSDQDKLTETTAKKTSNKSNDINKVDKTIIIPGFDGKIKEIMNQMNTRKHARNVTNLQKKMVAANQQWKCGQCGQMLDETYEVDHIIPLCDGGTNELSNLMALDPICHKKKTLQYYLK